MDDKVWRTFINGLDIVGDLVGDLNDEPIEEVPQEEENDEAKLLKRTASITRLRMDVYLITPEGDDKKAYMVNGNQVMEDMGIMTIKEALQVIKNRKKKNS